MGGERRTVEQVVAVVAIVVRDDRVLAMRRSADRDAGAGLWETISGRVEPGEDPCAAAAREVAEESGLTVDVDPRPVDAYSAMRGDRPMVVICYRARWRSGQVRRSAEHDAHAWWTPEELEQHGSPARLVKAVRRALAVASGQPPTTS